MHPFEIKINPSVRYIHASHLTLTKIRYAVWSWNSQDINGWCNFHFYENPFIPHGFFISELTDGTLSAFILGA